jgi:4-hydroxy-tetrahydrodipicolinate synthase
VTTTPLDPGLWAILATPFEGPRLDVDISAFQRQVEQVLAAGARGVVVLGVNGEATKLDEDERRALTTAAAGVAGPARVVAGITALATRPALREARVAVDAAGGELAGLMVQVNDPAPAIVVDHLTAIHDAVGAGIVLQDYPVVSGVRISDAALVEVVGSCPFVVGVKAETPPTTRGVAALTAGTDVPVFGGLGAVNLLDELAAGAAGAMTGFSRPEALVATIEAFHREGFEAARRTFAPFLPLATFEAQAGIALAVRKRLLVEQGVLPDGRLRPPGATFPEELLPILRAHLGSLEAGG